MKPFRALLVSPRTDRAGFTLVEVVLALAIVATAFIAVLGLLPAGLNQSRQAADSTVVAAIFEDLHSRLQGQDISGTTSFAASFSPAFFDDHGVFIPSTAGPSEQARRLYRADVKIGTWKDKPAGTSGLRPVTLELSWPVNPATGQALGAGNPKTLVTYTATTLTGPDWRAIDTTYVPKIEF
jgi:uncharacterized protein (TIGR02598 family)